MAWEFIEYRVFPCLFPLLPVAREGIESVVFDPFGPFWDGGGPRSFRIVLDGEISDAGGLVGFGGGGVIPAYVEPLDHGVKAALHDVASGVSSVAASGCVLQASVATCKNHLSK